MKNDSINRSAAIEAIEKHIRTAEEPYQLTDVDKVMNHAFEIAASCVYNLSATEPSAQPETAKRTAETAQNVSDGDLISRKDAIDVVSGIDRAFVKYIENLPPAQPKSYREGYQAGFKDAQPESAKRKMANNEWIDFLVSQFNVSRTSAKEMLHGMMRWKKEDNFKKQFNRRRQDGRSD